MKKVIDFLTMPKIVAILFIVMVAISLLNKTGAIRIGWAWLNWPIGLYALLVFIVWGRSVFKAMED